MANSLSDTAPVALDVTNLFPWKDIKDVKVAGQEMVFIPKFYVKNMPVNTYNAYFICGTQKSGYHLHPAFYDNGQATPNGILVSKYLASGTKTALDSVAGLNPKTLTRSVALSVIAGKNVVNGGSDRTGWHVYNIYEHHMLLRLALIEYGGTNFASLTEYHGVCDLGKNSSNGKTGISAGYWVDGLKAVCGSDANYFSWIIGNKTRTADVTTNKKNVAAGRYVRLMDMETTADYDLGDVFLTGQGLTAAAGGSYGADQAMSGFKVNITNPYFYCRCFDFSVYKLNPSANNSDLGTEKFVRFAKYC